MGTHADPHGAKAGEGSPGAGISGPFVVLGFDQATDPSVVYLETIPEGVYLDGSNDVSAYILAFGHLLAAALHPDESIALIKRRADARS